MIYMLRMGSVGSDQCRTIPVNGMLVAHVLDCPSHLRLRRSHAVIGHAATSIRTRAATHHSNETLVFLPALTGPPLESQLHDAADVVQNCWADLEQ